ncbi:MAG: deoxynucleoside kinase [Deinococcaceae bacterium]
MYIAVEGPIGVGKTSLSRILAEHYGAGLVLEVVEENPFLASFYQDPIHYRFQVQVFFLLSRFRQLEGLVQAELFQGNHVADYLFDKDFIFASMNLGNSEFELYRDLYVHLKPRLTAPDLVIYLRAETDLLLSRINQRGRTFEKEMSPEYLCNLNARYDEYFNYYSGNLLVLNGQDYDFVASESDRTEVIRQVEQALVFKKAAGD